MTSTMPTAGNFGQDWMSAEQSPDGLRNYLLRASPPVIAGNSVLVLRLSGELPEKPPME